MKNINKRLLTVFALVLSLSVSIGAAVAYFSDYEEASGGAVLNLGGKTELEEGEDKSQKDIVIKNTGETNMLVRVAILGEGVNHFKEQPAYSSEDWATSEDENGVLWYYYKKVLAPGKDTSDILAKMEFNWQGSEAPDYDFDITVVHESCQAVYNGSELASPIGWDQSIVKAIPLPATSGKEGE